VILLIRVHRFVWIKPRVVDAMWTDELISDTCVQKIASVSTVARNAGYRNGYSNLYCDMDWSEMGMLCRVGNGIVER